MISSSGNISLILRATESPPTPESNMPIGLFFIFYHKTLSYCANIEFTRSKKSLLRHSQQETISLIHKNILMFELLFFAVSTSSNHPSLPDLEVVYEWNCKFWYIFLWCILNKPHVFIKT